MLTLKRQIAAHKAVIAFLMFGLIVSILVISIGTSSIVKLKEIALIKEDAKPKYTLDVQYSFSKKTNFNTHLDILKNISDSSGAIIINNSVYLDESKKNYPLSIIYFNQVTEWSYPFYAGRYFTEKDMMLDSKVILIGKNLLKFIEQDNNKKYLKIEGTEYEVIGAIGLEGRETSWDDRIIMPFTSVPDAIKSKLEKNPITMMLYSDKVLPISDFDVIKNLIINSDENAMIIANESQSQNNNIILELITRKDNLIIYSILIYIIALINSVNITVFWINDRNYEIGVKKAFGHSNKNISINIFAEMMIIITICALIALLIQILLYKITSSIFTYPIKVTIENGIVAISFTFVTSILTSLIPIIKSFKIQPISIMNK